MKYLNEFMDGLPEMWQDYKNARHQRRAAKYREVSVADLTARFHAVGKYSLPIPTLLSNHLIEKYFGGYDNIDLSQPQHLAAVICFYENGSKPEFGSMNREQLDAEIAKRMATISTAQQSECYIECITQINLALQKKNLQHPQQMLEQMLQMLASQPSGAQS